MKKKVLVILITMLMILAMIPMNVFAISNTISNVLPSYFPTVSTMAWKNISGAYVMLEEGLTPMELSFYLSSDARVDIPVTSTIDENNEYTDGTIIVKFNMNDHVLESITLSGHANNKLNGTYKSETIADMLSKSRIPFPNAAECGWTNGNNIYIYTAVDGKEYLYISMSGLSIKLGKTAEPIVRGETPYTEFGDEGKVLFNFENDYLVSIEFSNVDPMINGTYFPSEQSIIEGKDGKWIKGDSNGLVIVSDSPFDKFVSVKVDGSVIDGDNYIVESGSTKVTLKKTYLDTLPLGSHTFEIVSVYGSAKTSFEIKSGSPETGLYDSVVIYIIALIALCTFVVANKKKTSR